MNNFNPDVDASQPTQTRKGNEQFPVDTKVLTHVSFDTNVASGELLRIVVMNDVATPRCSAYREYYYGNLGVFLDNVTSFTMRAGALEVSQQAVDEFVGSMSLHLDISQTARWDREVYVPQGTHKRLYKAVDPDDSTRMIGVLLEQDVEGRLTKITWYKTQNARDVFRATPGKLDFELVKNESGAPSLDPNDIAGWTWYNTPSIASGA